MSSIFTKIVNKEIPCYKVAETEKFNVESQARNRAAKVDLPAPEGDDRMINSPRRAASGLFDILNLLSHLINRCL